MSLESKVYTVEEANKESIEYFKGDEMAGTTFVKKYALKDSEGNIYESNPDQMHKRIAKEIARIESKYKNPLTEEKVYSLLKDFKYLIPGGSSMAGIGNDKQITSLSNCFVIGNKGASDSYGGIMKIDEEQVQLMKRRGGVGHDLGHIRPSKSEVHNSALTSTGVVPFMERYSNSTREVAQDGRRGALMLTIPIKHPDAEGFIDAKMESGKVTGANVSVKIDDKFMESLTNGEKYIQQYPINSNNPKVTREINPKSLWNKIVHNAWKSGEPGVMFWDTIIREAIPDNYGEDWKTISTNPCGEIPLCPHDSCRLLAVNLYSYVKNPFTEKASFDFDLFKEHSKYAQRIMDDIIDLEIEKIDSILTKIEEDPEAEELKSTEKNLWVNIKKKAEEGRRSGIGITAEGDMLAALRIRYGSKKGLELSTEVHKQYALNVYEGSVELAKERGAFKIYNAEKEKENPFIKRIKDADAELYKEMVKYGRRNISLLTIAPTGTISQMTQTTSGIEPVFLLSYERRRKVNPNDESVKVDYVDEVGDSWELFNVFHHKFEEWLKVNNYDVKKVKNYDKKRLDELVAESPYNKATSENVDWIAKVKMQGAIQKWVDHSISATVNLPKDTTEDMVSKIYTEAWKAGCKGVTVYRDGSRDGVLIKKENLEKKVQIVQKKVKMDKRLEIKPQTSKYKVKREMDSLHFILTSNLYMDDKNKKAYFIPDEDFQLRSPLGASSSVSFSQSGWDRTKIIKGTNPDYAEIVSNLQSVFSNELEGIGSRRIKSIEHAAGLVFEDYFKRNGIIGEENGILINLIKKPDLRKVEFNSPEYLEILSNLSLENSGEEMSINGNHGKLDIKFVCENCGGTDFRKEDGCPNPVCVNCGWSDPNKAC